MGKTSQKSLRLHYHKEFISAVIVEDQLMCNPCKHPGCKSHVSHPCEGCGKQWSANERAGKGCDLCGDFPVILSARCHMTAPLRAIMLDEDTIELRCYLPECDRLVATFKLAKQDEVSV